MYTRQYTDSRYPKDLSIPGNYSGNAFRKSPLVEDLPKEEPAYQAEYTKEDMSSEAPDGNKKEEAAPVSVSPLLGNSLFRRGGGGLGLEELLILGLVFIISQNDTKDDLAFLLMMLLFIQ